MHISRVYIENFKSIKRVDVEFRKGKNILVGKNNSGKSNIIKAIDLIFAESSPTWSKSESFSEKDFHSWKDEVEGRIEVKTAEDALIWCELAREPDEELNYEELYKCPGFYVHSKITGWDKSTGKNIPIREPYLIATDQLPTNARYYLEISEDDSQGKEYINPKLKNQRSFERELDDKYHFGFAFLAKKENGSIRKELRFFYRETEAAAWRMGFRASIRCELIQSAIIPSFRDPALQLKISSWSWYGRLMRYLTANHSKKAELEAAFSQVKMVADSIFSRVKDSIKQSSLSVAFPSTDISFQFNNDNQPDIYKSCVIYLDDGYKSPISEKGSGVQSVTIIGLFNYYTHYINSSTAALLCVEEPEIYLHPHARRVISDRLDDFMSGGRNQVVITTHSPDFIRTINEDMNIILVKKEITTNCSSINVREFKDLLLDNNQNELFFSDKVIICEGFDSYLLKIVSNVIFPKILDEKNISIFGVGSKDNISRMVTNVLKLGIDCLVLADFDYFLRDKSDTAKKYHAKQHESILSCGRAFFQQKCIYGATGGEVFSRIDRLRSIIKRDNEELFYRAKSIGEIDNKELQHLLPELRTNGVGILGGEIENYIKDKSLLSKEGKLNMQGIFILNKLVLDGKSIEDILDISPFVEFLESAIA